MTSEYFKAETHISTYNKFRPRPPKSLIQEIIKEASEQGELAIDVGCGSGQSTEVLAPFYKKVIGVDSSEEILSEAVKNCKSTNVSYMQCPAENLNVEDEKSDLVAICQALHWVSIPKFYSEVNRILKSNGIFAVYGYSFPVLKIEEGDPDLENIVKKFFMTNLGNYILPQSKKVYFENYSTPEFEEVYFVKGGKMKRMGNFDLETQGTLAEIIGYITSSSAFQNYTKQLGKKEGEKLLKTFEEEVKGKFGKKVEGEFKIVFPYFLLLGKKNNK